MSARRPPLVDLATPVRAEAPTAPPPAPADTPAGAAPAQRVDLTPAARTGTRADARPDARTGARPRARVDALRLADARRSVAVHASAYASAVARAAERLETLADAVAYAEGVGLSHEEARALMVVAGVPADTLD